MGFMAGFGNAFADSMENRRKEEASKRDDLFKLKFQQLLDNKDKIEARDKEVAKNTKLAKSYIQSTGADPKAIGQVFEWVDAGLDKDTIERNLLTGKFKIKESASNDQMKSAGLDPSAPQEADPRAAAPRNTELLGNNPKNPATKFRLPNIFEDRGARRDRITNNRLAEVTGQDPEQIQATLSGQGGMEAPDASGVEFQAAPPQQEPDPISTGKESAVELATAAQEYQNDPSESNKKRFETAKLRDNAIKGQIAWEQATQNGGNFSNTVVSIDPQTKVGVVQLGTQTANGWVDMTGQPILNARQLNEIEQKELFNLGSGQTEVPKFIEAVSDVSSLTRNFKLSDDLVQSDPRILTGAVSGGAKFLQRISTEVGAIQRTLDADGNFTDATKKAVDENVNRYQEMLGSDVTNLALKSKLFDALQIQIAYSLARMEGQTGTGSSNKDIDRFMSMIDGAGDPETYRQTMANQIIGRVSELEQKGALINEWNAKANSFKGATGWYPNTGVVPADIRTELGNSKDPLVKGGLETLLKYSDRGPIEGTGKAAVQDNPDTLKVSRKNLERLKANPTDEEKAMFDEAYGQPGLADRILNGEQ